MVLRNFIAALCLGLGLLATAASAAPLEEHVRVLPLLDSNKTVVDQPLVYPSDGTAKVQSVIVTMQPGEQTGSHKHPYPTYGYMLEGELTVEYADGETRVYKQGDAFLEAVDISHNGKNTGTVQMRILVVFMGIDGEVNSRMDKQQ
ncbi:MAG: cupin domain-containing protein [Pseudomonadota bacterium]